MKLAAITLAALFTFGTAAYGACGGQHACADGYTWSSETGSCVPKTVSS